MKKIADGGKQASGKVSPMGESIKKASVAPLAGGGKDKTGLAEA